MVFSAYQARHIKDTPATWGERLEASKKAIWGLLLPIIIIGGIYTGIFTPTEAAAVGVVLSFAISAIIYKNLTISNLKQIILATVKTNTMILFIIIGAMLLGFILTILQIPQSIVSFATSQDISSLDYIYSNKRCITDFGDVP